MPSFSKAVDRQLNLPAINAGQRVLVSALSWSVGAYRHTLGGAAPIANGGIMVLGAPSYEGTMKETTDRLFMAHHHAAARDLGLRGKTVRPPGDGCRGQNKERGGCWSP